MDEVAAESLPLAWDVTAYLQSAKARERTESVRYEPSEPEPTSISLRHVADIVAERREPNWLLHRVLEGRVLAIMAGVRGSFKSFIALDWTMRAALVGHTAIILSGEGGGLDRRIDAWMRSHAPAQNLRTLPVVALERAVNLNAEEVLAELQMAIAISRVVPALILVDTFSKFSPGLDENANTEVALFLARLSSELRDVYACTVLVVAHAGHGDARRPRGAYALMANPDAEYIVERPDPTGMLCTVSRERFKDGASLPPLAYMARSVDLGRTDRYGDPVNSLALDPTDAPPGKARGAWGRNQLAVIVALREWARANADASHIATFNITALLKTQGIGRKRKLEVLDSLVNARVLTPSIGGYTFDRQAL